jgi:peptidoglycan L-alanyl-D-glutamate endopeptidase CwlK
MATRDLNELLGPVKAKATAMLDACRSAGLDVIVTCTYRSDAEQSALYAQGRFPLAVVNQFRAEVGLAALTPMKNERKVTNARPGKSFHAKRRAIDVVPIAGGKPVWNADDPVWQKIGKIGRACGFEWGGDWQSFKEYPHFQDATAALDENLKVDSAQTLPPEKLTADKAA